MMKEELKPINNRLDNIDEELKEIKSDVIKINSKADKNTILLENLNTKMQTIAEVQNNHLEANERQFERVLQAQSNTNSLLTSSLQSVSDDVKNIGSDLNYVEQITGKNITDIAKLKSIK